MIASYGTGCADGMPLRLRSGIEPTALACKYSSDAPEAANKEIGAERSQSSAFSASASPGGSCCRHHSAAGFRPAPLARLTAERRSLLWLREVEGQTYTELAAIMDIPVGTVRSRLFAAREALRTIWHGERNTEGEE